jgi:acetyl esterase/lipase
LLRIAETIIAGGKTVSIFNLEYSLAPEAKFPTQIQQAGEAYSYLVKEVGVEESKIALMGDSAGGSIALGFLTHLQSPISSLPPIESLGRPGKGLYLISPWISLFSQNGYKETEESDLLEAGTLQRWANFAIGKKTKEEFATYTEFAGEVKGRASLRKILSERVWVSAGEDVLFLENIETFVRLAEAEGVDVKLEVKEGKPHDWQMAEAVGEEKAYLEGKLGDLDDGLMGGCWGIGRAILEWER